MEGTLGVGGGTRVLTLLSHAGDDHLAGISVKLFVCEPSARPVLDIGVILILGGIAPIRRAIRMQAGHYSCVQDFVFRGQRSTSTKHESKVKCVGLFLIKCVTSISQDPSIGHQSGQSRKPDAPKRPRNPPPLHVLQLAIW